jgi:hypothetical protein
MQAHTVFVAHYASHTDCYKRASSYSSIIGVFKNKNDAVHAALSEFDDLLDHLADNANEVKLNDPILQRFLEHDEMSPREEAYIFDVLTTMQNNLEGEFTLQADGKYIEIDEVELK